MANRRRAWMALIGLLVVLLVAGLEHRTERSSLTRHWTTILEMGLPIYRRTGTTDATRWLGGLTSPPPPETWYHSGSMTIARIACNGPGMRRVYLLERLYAVRREPAAADMAIRLLQGKGDPDPATFTAVWVATRAWAEAGGGGDDPRR